MPRRFNASDIAESRSADAEAEVSKEVTKVFGMHKPDECVPTGCTVLNLAVSGNARGGWKRGRVANIIGDSDTGKTMLALTTLAEAAHDERFSDWKLCFDDAEASSDFDLSQMFGSKTADRLVCGDDSLDEPQGSFFIEDFYNRTWKLLGKGKGGDPFIYVLDSMDALESKASMATFEENNRLLEADKDLKGSYGDGKAKANSTGLRKLKAMLKQTESVVLIVSQTRDNINPMSMQEKTRAGGRALKFYSCYELWLAKMKDIAAQVDGVKRTLGTWVRVRLSKNHATGKRIDFQIPLLYGYGVDDVRACEQWLDDEGYFKREKIGDNRKGWRKEMRTNPDALLDLMQVEWNRVESIVRKSGRYCDEVESAEE